MLKKICFVTVLFVGMVSCNSKKTAFDYSQDIVKKEQSLLPEIEKTESSVKKFLEAEQFDSIGAAGEKMEKLVDTKLNEIKGMPDPDAKGLDIFKTAAIKYFGFIKSMYTGYSDFGHAKTPETREQEMAKLQQIVADKPTAISNMQTAQKRFADENNFRLENKTPGN